MILVIISNVIKLCTIKDALEKNVRMEWLGNIGQLKKCVASNGKLTSANLVVQESAKPIFALTVVRRD